MKAGRWLRTVLWLWLGWFAAGFAVFELAWILWLKEDEPGGEDPLIYLLGTAFSLVWVPVYLLMLRTISRADGYRLFAVLLGVAFALVQTLSSMGAGYPGMPVVYIGLGATVPRAPRRKTSRDRDDRDA